MLTPHVDQPIFPASLVFHDVGQDVLDAEDRFDGAMGNAMAFARDAGRRSLRAEGAQQGAACSRAWHFAMIALVPQRALP